ncbi:hypothetical protein AX16_004774 [Volvariella volvacea WC 439]|nr:hypothetical protein AX16_004774 [Volvariella volvacea WC 439]
MANGALDPSGAYRYVVKYADAGRWQPSTVVSAWNLPAGVANSSSLPPACPQWNVDPSAYNEDCLSMILYVPPGLTVTSNVPTLMWIHGGSFYVGSATAPGLDGSQLAIATQSIVAVVQYRLGALGFLAPSGETNLAVKDSVNALRFLRTVLPAFGGSANKITVSGQSAGANMVRALLAVPSASNLFRSAVLHSDPMNYGFLSTSTQQTLQTYFNGLISCSPSDTNCLNSLSLSSVLSASKTIYDNGASIDPAAGMAQPMRPVLDGSFITSPLDSTGVFPSVNKPVMITSVMHEAGWFIYDQFPTAPPTSWYSAICEATFGPDRTSLVLSSSFYTPSSDIREQLQVMGTDYLWKCSGWTFARNWVQNGGNAYVGLFNIGASYPGNDAVSWCTQNGHVCHQDDIQLVFGTAPNPSTAQSDLITEIQQRYRAFLNNGNPNAPGLTTWTAAGTSDVHVLPLGDSTPIDVGACDPTFWGSTVEYDYQFYN